MFNKPEIKIGFYISENSSFVLKDYFYYSFLTSTKFCMRLRIVACSTSDDVSERPEVDILF